MSETYDNKQLLITGRNRDRFDLAIQLSQHDKAVGWAEKTLCRDRDSDGDQGYPGVKTLVFYWTDTVTDGFHKFPTELDNEGMSEVAWKWLKNLPEEDFKTNAYNDPDVWEERGWLIYNDFWGHVGGSWQAFVGIQPYCCWIGK